MPARATVLWPAADAPADIQPLPTSFPFLCPEQRDGQQSLWLPCGFHRQPQLLWPSHQEPIRTNRWSAIPLTAQRLSLTAPTPRVTSSKAQQWCHWCRCFWTYSQCWCSCKSFQRQAEAPRHIVRTGQQCWANGMLNVLRSQSLEPAPAAIPLVHSSDAWNPWLIIWWGWHPLAAHLDPCRLGVNLETLKSHIDRRWTAQLASGVPQDDLTWQTARPSPKSDQEQRSSGRWQPLTLWAGVLDKIRAAGDYLTSHTDHWALTAGQAFPWPCVPPKQQLGAGHRNGCLQLAAALFLTDWAGWGVICLVRSCLEKQSWGVQIFSFC